MIARKNAFLDLFEYMIRCEEAKDSRWTRATSSAIVDMGQASKVAHLVSSG